MIFPEQELVIDLVTHTRTLKINGYSMETVSLFPEMMIKLYVFEQWKTAL